MEPPASIGGATHVNVNLTESPIIVGGDTVTDATGAGTGTGVVVGVGQPESKRAAINNLYNLNSSACSLIRYIPFIGDDPDQQFQLCTLLPT